MENTGAKVAAGEVLAVPPKCAVRSLVAAAAEQGDARSAGEMTVQAVVLHLREFLRSGAGLIFRVGARDALDHHVAAEFAGDDDQGAVEQTPFLQVAD